MNPNRTIQPSEGSRKRKQQSGAVHRKQKIIRIEAEKRLTPITAFFDMKNSPINQPVQSNVDNLHLSDENVVVLSDELVNEPIPDECITESLHVNSSTDKTIPIVSNIEIHDLSAENTTTMNSSVVASEILRTSSGTFSVEPIENCVTSFNVIENPSLRDIGVVNKQSESEIFHHLRLDVFNILDFNDIPCDITGRKFPKGILSKKLQNHELIYMDYLRWSDSKKALYCAPCHFFKDTGPVSALEEGWSLEKGWKKLIKKNQSHERFLPHKQAYIKWKDASHRSKTDSTVDNLLYCQMMTEKERCHAILKRCCDVIMFLCIRGLPLYGSNSRLGNDSNGNFLGLIEFLSKYDLVIQDHVEKVKQSQQQNRRMQAHYLSPTIVNELLSLIGLQTKRALMIKVKAAMYFSTIVDSTPDISKLEQYVFVIRYSFNSHNVASSI